MAAIGRELSAEVEKIFETKISPEAMRARVRSASKRGGENLQATETPATAAVEPGDSGDKIDVPKLVEMVAEFVDSKKGSIRQGCAAVAAKAGRKAVVLASPSSRFSRLICKRLDYGDFFRLRVSGECLCCPKRSRRAPGRIGRWLFPPVR